MGRFRRFGVVLVLGCAGIALAAGIAVAAFPDSDVKTYTGCLTAGGNVASLQEGNTPAKPCTPTQQAIKLGGGDITKVAVTGALTGGGENGAVTIGLDGTQTVPGTCSSGQVPKWDGSAWACAADNNTEYHGDTGINLSNSGSGWGFSIAPAYRLPQSCANGAVPESDGAGGWSCGTDDVGAGPPVYHAANDHVVESETVAQQVVGLSDLPAGNYVLWTNVENTAYRTSSGYHLHDMRCSTSGSPNLFAVRGDSTSSETWAGYLNGTDDFLVYCILEGVQIGDDDATLASATVTAMRVGPINP